MTCIVCQITGAAEHTGTLVGFMIDNTEWSLVGGGWGVGWGRGVHDWVNQAQELGYDVSRDLWNEWTADDGEARYYLPTFYEYEIRTGGILYDPDADILFHAVGAAIVSAESPPCRHGVA